MYKKILILFPLLCCFTSCMVTDKPLINPIMAVSFPHDAPLGVPELGDLEGTGSVISILGLVNFGDASIRTAARNAGIKTICTIDHEVFTVFGIYSELKTIVTGYSEDYKRQ